MYKFLLIAIVLFFIILYINNSNLQNFNNFIITHKNRGDRSGSLLLIDLLFYVFALKNNYIFKFYPFKDYQNQVLDANILRNFLGLNEQIKTLTKSELKKTHKINYKQLRHYEKTQSKKKYPKLIVCLNDDTKQIEKRMLEDNEIDSYFSLDVREMLFNNYKLQNPNYPIYFEKSKTNIVIHIRRGDVTPTYYEHAYVKNNIFINIIKELQQKYSNSNILVFSCKTNTECWDDFKNLDIRLILREDWSNDNLQYELIDMQHFIEADVLVIGGTFSYVPAFFNLNTVYYPSSFWHSELKHWETYKSK